MKVIIFSHESDLDGIFSAAIGLIRYPQARPVFLNYGAEGVLKMRGFIEAATRSSQEKGIVIISDLGLSCDPSLIDSCTETFSIAKNKGWSIVWIDHHPWPENAIRSIEPHVELVLDSVSSKCAAELIYEKFLSGNRVAEKLASLAHTMDYFTNDQYLTPTSELIKYYHNFPDCYSRLIDLARKSSHGTLWDIEMQSDYNDYVVLRDEAKKHAFSTMRIRDIHNFKIAFIQSSPFIQNSLFSDEVFKKTDVDLVMVYGTDGRVSIRRNNNDISCNDIASNLPEGGGHIFAAGATFRSNPGDIESVIMELERAVLTTLERTDKADNL
ncbi:MAG TPA: DHH family phosphoesterase [Candidatus Nitrosopolaris sp.]|nr:DHH family phosphoesterase [Candidatus Nitrosopolaris sp.]